MFGTRGLQLRTVFQYVGPFCLLWMVTNFLYVSALGVIPATDVTALFSSCNAFVYIFSLIWLKEKLAIVKVRFHWLHLQRTLLILILLMFPISVISGNLFLLACLFQMVAVTMCIGGIVLMAYAEGFKGPNAVGVTLSAGAAVGAALYKVKKQTCMVKKTALPLSLLSPPRLRKKPILEHYRGIGLYRANCLSRVIANPRFSGVQS